ncbi:MAG: hypothetical protein QXO27_04465 [Candidatus Aenigmatarchaeota archaeon]
MADNKKIFLIFMISLVLFFCGCVSQENNTRGNGVIIEKFKVDFEKVYAGESFKIWLSLRNIGSSNAYNVYPKLYNVQTSSEGGVFEISCKESCMTGVKLLPPDREAGTEGESLTCIWDCITPKNISKGLSIKFNPSVRVYYWYTSDVIKGVNIVSKDELRNIKNKDVSLPSETLLSTSGPIILEVIINGPIRFFENENKVSFPINVKIKNIGDGVACSLKEVTIPLPFGTLYNPSFTFANLISGCEVNKNWNKITVFFDKGDDPSINLIECEISEEGSTIELWQGKERTITCEVEFDISKILDEEIPNIPRIQKNLRFYAEYAYFIDASTSIEVIGR